MGKFKRNRFSLDLSARHLVLLFVMPLLFSTTALAQGGPPMITDDPGTPGNGHWEINLVSLFSSNSERTLIQAPYFDVNYGLGDRTQLKVESGWVFANRSNTPLKNGGDILVLGVKYRFVDEATSGISISTYPQYQSHAFYSTQDRDLTNPGDELLVPFEFSKTFGNWILNPEIGILSIAHGSNQAVYGIVFAYENLKPWELLFEFHGNTALSGTGTELLLNGGGRFSVNPSMNLLFAMGHTVSQFDGEPAELDSFFGFQFEI